MFANYLHVVTCFHRRKLEVTQHQLADQHAYTVRLRQQTTDKDLLEQEQLVKRQLQKRLVIT